MLLLIPFFFMSYIIFKMPIPQNYTKHLPFQASQIQLFPQLPPLRQAAECPSSAKSKEWAKQNMAEVPRRRNLPSALRKSRTGEYNMPRWDHAERAAWRHGSRTGGAGSQAKAQSHFIFKEEQKCLSLNRVLGLLSPLQVIKENCKPAEVRCSLKGPKMTEDVSV